MLCQPPVDISKDAQRGSETLFSTQLLGATFSLFLLQALLCCKPSWSPISPTGWPPGSFVSLAPASLSVLHFQDDGLCGACPLLRWRLDTCLTNQERIGVEFCWDLGQSSLVFQGTLLSKESTTFFCTIELTPGIRERDVEFPCGVDLPRVLPTEGL